MKRKKSCIRLVKNQIDLIKRIIFLVNLVVLALTALALTSPYIDPNSFWLSAVAGLFFPFLLVINILFAIFWLIIKWPWALLSLLVIAFSWKYFDRYVSFHPQSVSGESSGILLGSYNTFGFNPLKKSTRENPEEAVTKFKDFFSEFRDLDILCLQETNNFSSSLLREFLGFSYEHRFTPQGVSILSRYPIEDMGTIPFSNHTNSCVWADLRILPDMKIRVYSTHFQSNLVSKEAGELAETGEISNSSSWLQVFRMINKYRLAAAKRAHESGIVRRHIEKSPYPVILCGDFNDHPISYSYQHLISGFKDSFAEKGRGLGVTYSGVIPFLRIDYILAQEAFKINSHTVLSLEFSDHNLIVANIAVRK